MPVPVLSLVRFSIQKPIESLSPEQLNYLRCNEGKEYLTNLRDTAREREWLGRRRGTLDTPEEYDE